MQEEVQQKMQAVYADALKQSTALATQLVERELNKFRKEFQSESAMQVLNNRIAKEMPKAITKTNAPVLKAVLPTLMKHAKNDPDKAFKLLTTFFRKTNKSILANNEQRGRFGTTETPASKTGTLDLESLEGFLK